jgi:hypothetical protein
MHREQHLAEENHTGGSAVSSAEDEPQAAASKVAVKVGHGVDDAAAMSAPHMRG